MSSLFQTIDKIKPVYDKTYEFVLFLCKMSLTMDILIICMAAAGRHVSFISNPAWSEEIALTYMAYMAVFSVVLVIRRNVHIRTIAFDIYPSKTAVRALDILSDMAVLTLTVIMITVGWKHANGIGSKGTYVSMPWLPWFWMYSPVPLVGVAMVISELEALYNYVKATCMGEEE